MRSEEINEKAREHKQKGGMKAEIASVREEVVVVKCQIRSSPAILGVALCHCHSTAPFCDYDPSVYNFTHITCMAV
jgi:hypothetical protein